MTPRIYKVSFINDHNVPEPRWESHVLPLDYPLIDEDVYGSRSIGERHGLKNEFGSATRRFTAMHFRVRFYLDQNDPDEIARMRLAVPEAGALIEEITARTGAVRWLR